MKYKLYQNICFVFTLGSFLFFLYHFIKGENYLIDIIVMAISFIAIGVFSFLNSNDIDNNRKENISKEEEKLKQQALINIEKEILNMGKQNTITYLEKNDMLEKEMDNLRGKLK